MTFTSLATPVANTPISSSTFGALVKQDLDDLDSRVASNAAILGTWSGGTVISRLIWLEGSAYAKFSQTGSAQTLGASNVQMQFGTNTNTNTLIVTTSGTNNNTFTAVKSGVYNITASVRCTTAGATPELSIYTPGNVAFAIGNVKASNGAGSRSCTVCTEIQFNAGDTFAVNSFNAGTSSTVDTTWGTATNITIRYMGT